MAEHKMSVVDGVRYRPEDVPEGQTSPTTRQSNEKSSDAQHKARRPAKGARSGDDASDE